MKWQSIIIAVMLLLPALVQAQETNNAYLILKPHELLPQRFKAPADIIKQIEEQKTQLSSIRFLSWQEFSLYGTPHTLVIWYDANPNMVSSQSFVIHTYYHDKSGWRFYSVDRNPSPISVAVDRKKKMFTFVDVVPIKTIQFTELKAPEKEGSNK